MRTLKLLALTTAALFSANGQTTDKSLTFDAAAIKPFVPPTGGRGMVMMRGGRGGPGSTDPGRINYPMTTLKGLLTIAYDVKDFQISGPSWLDSERFEVQATMPPETTKEQLHIMLQNLLADRFKVTIHHETKELPMYSLVVGKGGPKMKESPEISAEEEAKDPTPPRIPDGPPKRGPDGFPVLPLNFGGRGGMFMMMTPFGTRLVAQRQTMQQLADRLSSELSKPVTDATELKPKYDFTLTFSREGLNNNGMMLLGPPPGEGGREGGRGPKDGLEPVEPPQTIFAAVQSQLGLKLDPKKGPVDLIVVDHAEKTPTEN
jgi:uncharacterized protein (TIGR03435 family)